MVPAIASDNAGGAYISWYDFRTTESQIYLQRIGPDGNPVLGWVQDGIPVAGGLMPQQYPAICEDGEGGVLIAWQAGLNPQGRDIFIQRITATGAVAPGWPAEGVTVCAAFYDQYSARLVPDGSGGAVIVWTDWRTPLIYCDVYAQHVLGTGQIAPGWPADGIALTTQSGADQFPSVVSDGSGGILAAWSLNNQNVFAQRLLADGSRAPGWPANGISVGTDPFGTRSYPHIAVDGAGGAFIVWSDGRGGPAQIYGQHIMSSGVKDPTWPFHGRILASSPASQGYGGPQNDHFGTIVVPDGVGGAIVAWGDERLDLGGPGVFALRFAANGDPWPGWPQTGVLVGGATGEPACAADNLGGMAIAMRDTEYPYSQWVTPTGAIAEHWSTAGLRLGSPEQYAALLAIAMTGPANATVVWQEELFNGERDIYAQQVSLDMPTAVLPYCLESVVVGRRVELKWRVSGELIGAEFDVYRSVSAVDASVVGRSTAQEDMIVAFSDEDVRPGQRLTYWLHLAGDERERRLGRVEVYVPEAAIGSISLDVTSPARGAISCNVQLPNMGPARLELFNVGGKRLYRQDVSSKGSIVLRALDTFAPGVYQVRLVQGDAQVIKRVVLVDR